MDSKRRINRIPPFNNLVLPGCDDPLSRLGVDRAIIDRSFTKSILTHGIFVDTSLDAATKSKKRYNLKLQKNRQAMDRLSHSFNLQANKIAALQAKLLTLQQGMYNELFPQVEEGIENSHYDEDEEYEEQEYDDDVEYSQWETDEGRGSTFFLTSEMPNDLYNEYQHPPTDANAHREITTTAKSDMSAAVSDRSHSGTVYEEEGFEEYSQSRAGTASVTSTDHGPASVPISADLTELASKKAHIEASVSESESLQLLLASVEGSGVECVEATDFCNEAVLNVDSNIDATEEPTLLSGAVSDRSLSSAVYEEEDFEEYNQSRAGTASNSVHRGIVLSQSRELVNESNDGSATTVLVQIQLQDSSFRNSDEKLTYQSEENIQIQVKDVDTNLKLNMDAVSKSGRCNVSNSYINDPSEHPALSMAVSATSLYSVEYEDEDFEEYSQSFDELSTSTIKTTVAPAPPLQPKPSSSSPRKAEAISRNAEAVKSGARYSKKSGEF